MHDDGVHAVLLSLTLQVALCREHGVLHVIVRGFFHGSLFQEYSGNDFVNARQRVAVVFPVEHPEQRLGVAERGKSYLRNVQPVLAPGRFGEPDVPVGFVLVALAERGWRQGETGAILPGHVHEAHGPLRPVRVELLRVDVQLHVAREIQEFQVRRDQRGQVDAVQLVVGEIQHPQRQQVRQLGNVLEQIRVHPQDAQVPQQPHVRGQVQQLISGKHDFLDFVPVRGAVFGYTREVVVGGVEDFQVLQVLVRPLQRFVGQAVGRQEQLLQLQHVRCVWQIAQPIVGHVQHLYVVYRFEEVFRQNRQAVVLQEEVLYG